VRPDCTAGGALKPARRRVQPDVQVDHRVAVKGFGLAGRGWGDGGGDGVDVDALEAAFNCLEVAEVWLLNPRRILSMARLGGPDENLRTTGR
jgi:hypothetical protein